MLHTALLNAIDIKEENIHIPDGSVPEDKISKYCEDFDKAARELDLLVIGMGEAAQIGFNEAGSSAKSKTRTVLLSYPSRKRQAKNFNGDFKHTPSAAITMGIDTMMSAKKIILMAWGEDKADAISHVVEHDACPDYPASLFQGHPDICCYVDENAGSLLTRVVSPWLVGSCEWTRKFIRKAVVWLCQEVHKPILKLTQRDYLEHSLGELLDKFGPFDKINIDVFNDLQHTITGWPGGKPDADDSQRPVSAKPFPKTVLIFSPHPDDDVISMGGTFIRLVHQGHNVHVAYETSGDLADPHGTHRVCTEAALESIEQLKEEGEKWIENTHVWLYRGAWMEWEIGRVDMAVPLSPDEVVEKRHAIFRHLSQKDIVPFPGDDPREFWQRAEDRTQNTARIYDELGMAEYQAIEVFLKLY